MQVKLLTFDLDDTLWALRPVLLRAEQAVQHWLQTNFPDFAATWTREKLFALRHEVLQARPELRHQISQLRLDTMQLAMLRSGLSTAAAESAAEQAFEIFLEARHQVELFDQAEASLLDLSERYRLAALTNGNADIFRLELGGIFSFAFRAEELGASKPDPAPFLAVQRAARVSAQEMIHIGDHAEHDIAAAQQLGIRAIWANLLAADWCGEQLPDAEIRHFSELADTIERLSLD